MQGVGLVEVAGVVLEGGRGAGVAVSLAEDFGEFLFFEEG